MGQKRECLFTGGTTNRINRTVEIGGVEFLACWLVVVEFVIYVTPGPHGFAPRDIDRKWSIASPLAKELSPFEVLSHEPMSDYCRRLLNEY